MNITCKNIPETYRRLASLDSRVGILIPAYNEAEHLSDLLKKCRGVKPARVLVIDDASNDLTPKILNSHADSLVHWIRNPHNLGKQGSIRRGLVELAELDLDAIALIDGDGQHDPRELPRLASFLDEYDFVIGCRSREQMPIQRQFSNLLANLSFQLITGVNFLDLQSGLRIYRSALARILAERLPENGGFAVEHESLALLSGYAVEQGQNLKAVAIPISCPYGKAVSHIGPWEVIQLTYQTIRQALRFRFPRNTTSPIRAGGLA